MKLKTQRSKLKTTDQRSKPALKIIITAFPAFCYNYLIFKSSNLQIFKFSNLNLPQLVKLHIPIRAAHADLTQG